DGVSIVLGKARRPPRTVRLLLPLAASADVASTIRLVFCRRGEHRKLTARYCKHPHRKRLGDAHPFPVFMFVDTFRLVFRRAHREASARYDDHLWAVHAVSEPVVYACSGLEGLTLGRH